MSRTHANLLSRLAAALARETAPWCDADLVVLPETGLAHDHVRLCGHGALARLPKQSQMNWGAAGNLAYQAACFTRASASGRAPRLLGALHPSPELPRGGLIVEEIEGWAASLPRDLAAIATALARIHRLALPAPSARPPLLDAPDALADLLAEIETQAVHLDAAGLDPAVRRAIAAEITTYAAVCAQAPRPAKCLIAFDAHPGNFLIRPDGSAVLVDLEKCRYSHAGLDLAHATLYTSTTWDAESCAVLSVAEVAQAHADWALAFGPGASDQRRWHLPLRRAMWLWSTTWCAKWRVVSAAAAPAGADGEDWSAERTDATLIDHVRERVDHYLDPGTVDRVRAEFEALAQVFGETA